MAEPETKPEDDEPARPRHRFLKYSLWILATATLVYALGTPLALYSYSRYQSSSVAIPNPDEILNNPNAIQYADGTTDTVPPLDPNGNTITHQDAPLAAIPKLLQDAVVAAEDVRFYRRSQAVDIKALYRAWLSGSIWGRDTQGGSTLATQLAKILDGQIGQSSREEKLHQITQAWALQKNLGRSGILEHYLNLAYFGRGAYGITAALQAFFGITLSHFSQIQTTDPIHAAGIAATIAALIQSPTAYSLPPNWPALEKRRNHVLDTLARQNWITYQTANIAISQPITTGYLAGWKPTPNPLTATRYPYIVQLIDSIMRTRYPSQWRHGSLTVQTCYNPSLDTKLRAAITSYPTDLDTAATVIRPSDGCLLALYPGRDYTPGGLDLALYGHWQQGSTAKITVLAGALAQGINPYQAIQEGCITLADHHTITCDDGYTGQVNAITAFARSENAVYTEIWRSIPDQRAAINLARTCGLGDTLLSGDPVPPGPTLVDDAAHGPDPATSLGSAALSATIANNGVHIPTGLRLKVTDRNGQLLYDDTHALANPDCRMTSTVASTLRVAMQGVIQNGTARTIAFLGPQAGGKTGSGSHAVRFTGFNGPEVAMDLVQGYDQQLPIGTILAADTAAHPWAAFMSPIPSSAFPAFDPRAAWGAPPAPASPPPSPGLTPQTTELIPPVTTPSSTKEFTPFASPAFYPTPLASPPPPVPRSIVPAYSPLPFWPKPSPTNPPPSSPRPSHTNPTPFSSQPSR